MGRTVFQIIGAVFFVVGGIRCWAGVSRLTGWIDEEQKRVNEQRAKLRDIRDGIENGRALVPSLPAVLNSLATRIDTVDAMAIHQSLGRVLGRRNAMRALVLAQTSVSRDLDLLTGTRLTDSFTRRVVLGQI